MNNNSVHENVEKLMCKRVQRELASVDHCGTRLHWGLQWQSTPVQVQIKGHPQGIVNPCGISLFLKHYVLWSKQHGEDYPNARTGRSDGES